jgi:hypothetical protein
LPHSLLEIFLWQGILWWNSISGKEFSGGILILWQGKSKMEEAEMPVCEREKQKDPQIDSRNPTTLD